MAYTNLKDRTKKFGLLVLNYLDKLPSKQPYTAIAGQLTRSATSVGANYRASQRAKSSADFINKLKIVGEECDESLFFLELLSELRKEDTITLTNLHKEGSEILSMIVTAIKTARSRQS